MKAAELRQSILQAAVQGKLVPQNVHDEPASELLKRIQQEKARLVKEGKIKKGKLLPQIAEDEIPYDLPDGWFWCRLQDICLKLTDGAHSTPRYVDAGVPFLSVKDISAGKIDFSATRFISKEEHDELYKRCNPQEGDILLTKVGTTGIPVIVDTDKEFSLFVSIALLKISRDNCNIDYLCHLIKSPLVYCQSQENTRGVGNKNWVLTAIANTIIPIPPISEQQRIVTKVDEFMALCDELEAAEKELDALEGRFAEYLPKSILQAAVQGKLVPQNVHDEPASELLKHIQQEKARLVEEGKIKREKPLLPISEDEMPYDLSDGWVWCRANDVCTYIQRGKSPIYSEIKKYPVLSQKCVQWSGIDFSKVKHIAPETLDKYEDTRFLKTDDLLWNSTGQGTLGRIMYYDEAVNIYELAVADSHVTIVRPYKNHVLSQYLFYWFASPTVQGEVELRATGSTKQIELSTEIIRNWLIPLPPLAEQQRIVAKVDELMALCDELEATKVLTSKTASSNVVPFPQRDEDEELLMVAQGEVSGELSEELKQAQEDLFGDGADE